MSKYPEASLIDSKDGIQFKVYSNAHPKGFVIAKLKYVPTSLMNFTGLKKRFLFGKSMFRFNLFNSKEVVKHNLDEIKKKFPNYIYKCDKHKNWFLGIPENEIGKFYDPRQGLQEFLQVPVEDMDDYLKATKKIIGLLVESGIQEKDIGISHSTLLGNYTPGKSDIDILVFGIDNGWKAVNHLEKSENPSLKWKSKEDWLKYYRDRVVSNVYTESEYVANMVRKRDDGFIDGNVFSIFCVENQDDLWYDWDADHEPLGVVKLKGKVKDARYSIVRPGYYELEESRILSGHEDVPIKRIVTWSRPFNLQAKEGEYVEACGLLEKVKSNGQEYYQIVIGYFDTYTTGRGEEEYLKALIN